MAKTPTPDQARAFHEAMTGIPLCFPDCCLCNATDEVDRLKLIIKEAIYQLDAGDSDSALEELEEYE